MRAANAAAFLLAAALLAACAHERPELRAGQAPPQAPQKEVRVTAVRYHFAPAAVRVRQGEKVRLVFVSEDVMHGLSIPALGVDKMLRPHEPVVVEFYAASPGTLRIHCSHWCGLGHFFMTGRIIIDPKPS